MAIVSVDTKMYNSINFYIGQLGSVLTKYSKSNDDVLSRGCLFHECILEYITIYDCFIFIALARG